MLISLRSDHKEHLQLLTTQPPQVITDFCNLSADFIQNGPNLKKYTIAAQKLSVELDVVQNCVYGLINLLMLSCQHQLSDADFRDSVLTLGFSQEQQTVLSKFYESKQTEMSEIISKLGINELHYNDLDWRFEVQISSRSLLHQTTPIITMNLNLKAENEDGSTSFKDILLQTDPNNLLHIANELEKALNQSTSRQIRKIERIMNH